MSGESITTLTGNLTDDPQLRMTPSGDAVASFTVASSPRILDRASGQWRDGDTMFLRCLVWRDMAENTTASLARGDRVLVTGRLKQRTFTTSDGQNRTVIELDVVELGASLRYATAQLHRPARSLAPHGSEPA